MNLLLDTQIFIWWDSEPEKLSPELLALCEDPANLLLLSIASVWEIQIKTQLGKLDLNLPLSKIIEKHQRENALILLPIELPHVLGLQDLPLHHKDPFDRLLVAQTITEKLTLLSVDRSLANYPISILGVSQSGPSGQ
jgi:PIN domain nuclease of toxin-antitoxin system